MILYLDAGNSRIKWGLRGGLREGGHWRAQGNVGHDHIANDEFMRSLPIKPGRIVACNVAGAPVAAAIEALAHKGEIPLEWFRSSASAGGVVNGYDTPSQLGADRWAALIGARAIHKGETLVVMAGTATTIDVLDARGVFRGGLILPGLDLMRHSLSQNTANLPEANGKVCISAPPTHTDDAITTGILMATLGAIERMAEPWMCRSQATRRSASADFLCLISGGAASEIAAYLTLPLRHVENLVLDGLASLQKIG